MTDEKHANNPEPKPAWDHWEQLIETTDDPIAIIDSDFVVLHFNQSFSILAPGFKPGTNFRDLIIREHLQTWDDALRDLSGHKVISVHIGVHSDRLIRWLAIRVLPVIDAEKPTRYFAICVDVTDTMNFETELRKREQILQRAEHLGGLATWTWDIIADRGYWSDNMFRLFGHEPQCFIPKYEMFMQAVHPDDRAPIEKVLAGIQAPDPEMQINEFESEFRIRTSQGPCITVYSHGEVERDSNGRAIRTIGILLDITERREFERRLRESETLLESTGQIARIGGWELRCETRETTFTKEVYRILELPVDYQLTLETSLNFLHKEDRPTLRLAVEKAVEQGEPFDLALRFTTSSERELFVRARCTTVREHGKVILLRGTFQDITEIKQMELALVATNEQLRVQQDLLEQKNIALKEILSHVQDDSERTKQQISQNLERLVRPTLAKLRIIVGDHGRTHLEALESTIAEITSPFVVEIEKRFTNLTPREMEICHHIKHGLRSKEIADILSISVQTVEKFRQKIRKKLGIEGTTANLSSYLRSLRGK